MKLYHATFQSYVSAIKENGLVPGQQKNWVDCAPGFVYLAKRSAVLKHTSLHIAQGLQHRNTGDDTWADAKVITETLTIGGEEINVMPKNN